MGSNNSSIIYICFLNNALTCAYFIYYINFEEKNIFNNFKIMMTQKDLEEYKKTLEGKSNDELREIEKKLIEDAEAMDKTVSEKTFDLPKENYAEAVKAIRFLLNKVQVTWQYTLAMVGMYDFWTDKNPGKIPYAQLDSLLHTIGDLRFTGYEEWAMVVALNKYLEPLTKEYQDTTAEIYDIASKHSAVQDALGLSNPIA